MIEPLLLDIPASIETERLLLRHPRAGDGAAHHEAVAESITDLRRYLASLPWVAAEPSVTTSELYCRAAESNFLARKDLPYLIWHKRSGQLAGATGLHRTDWATPKTEIGYWCRSACSGQGVITEAVTALSQLAFGLLAVARLELITDEENRASRRVAERCGFALEGVLRNERRAPDGSLRNTCVYARYPAPR